MCRYELCSALKTRVLSVKQNFLRISQNKTYATRGLLATDHVILNHGQVTWTTPEPAPPLLTTTPHQLEDVSALDRFNVHRCPTRRVFSGTGIELMTCLPWLDTLTTGLPQPPLAQRLDSPEWGLACSRSLSQASRLPASVVQFLILKTRRSFSRPSIHLRFGLPFLRVPIGRALKNFLVVQSSSTLTTWTMAHGEEDKISSSITHIKNLTSSKYNKFNGQVTLSE
ncbi:uncharacterized protein TNCV_2613621 [Trichonephila clavipes]|nr:uncharacterized protein TNCV_2613621 [Trichonephila clavipes]